VTTATLPPGAIGPGPTVTLLALSRYCAEHGRPPTLRRLAADRDVSLSTVVGHIERLRSRQLVTWEAGASCTLRPTVEAVAFATSLHRSDRPSLPVIESKDQP
jgi:DNA-binding MarR family transcriptional regulator